MSRPELTELQIADPPERWAALGFTVADTHADVGGVRLRLGARGTGIVAWGLHGIAPTDAIDGLATTSAPPPAPPATHPNGATGIDHVVVLTPDFDRTAAVLAEAGMALRRIREIGSIRQGFRRLGPAILELVEGSGAAPVAARFWGLVVIVDDLDGLAQRLGEQLAPAKPAVQPGRRIATLRGSAGLTTRLAFMTPEPVRRTRQAEHGRGPAH